MRVRVYFIYLFFLLLAGTHNFYAGTFRSSDTYSLSQNLTKNNQIKVAIEDYSIILIEDFDVEVEEEIQRDSDVKENCESSFFTGKYTLLNTLYLPLCRQFVLNNCNDYFKIIPYLSGNPRPIYITQRVLRI
jgi:hypothetical protein